MFIGRQGLKKYHFYSNMAFLTSTVSLIGKKKSETSESHDNSEPSV